MTFPSWYFFCYYYYYWFFSLSINYLDCYISTTFFIMHFLCIPCFCLHIMCMCVHAFIDFLIDLPFFHIFPMFMFIFIYPFFLIFFFQMIQVLSIVSLIALPFQNIRANCHVADVIIFPMGGVHYNDCSSKSMV
jgi:hypothetical protein